MLTHPKGLIPKSEESKGIALSALLTRVKGIVHSELGDPVWVRAEVRRVQTARSGHVYLELEERDEQGQTIATTKGVMFGGKFASLQAKFTEGTGGEIKADIKVLVFARAEFHPLYGFDLIIEDIDPSYTIGDLLARMEAIRATLRKEGVFGRNRMLPSPRNFFRVAVISPATSAGLGDFQNEAERLQRAGLCMFDFFTATFQGKDTSQSIRNALRAVFDGHKRRPYDALAIIRGGGSATDLAWLNELELTRWVCRIPIPVFTGIGHAPDSTVLDDVAHHCFDTPSKVVLHISQTIRQNAWETLGYAKEIEKATIRILTHEAQALEYLRGRVEERTQRTIFGAQSGMDRLAQQIRLTSAHRCREAQLAFDTARNRVVEGLSGALRLATSDTDRALESVRIRSRTALVTWSGQLRLALHEIRTNCQASALFAARRLEGTFSTTRAGIPSAVRTARLRMEHSIQRILGLGPDATLRRGYAIARDPHGRPVSSAARAQQHERLTLQFRDGHIHVENRNKRESP
jgi:exodeoxyribonuclease VII large subunit